MRDCGAPRHNPAPDKPVNAHRSRAFYPLADYDLDATLTSGQAFRWRKVNDCWEGVIGSHWVRLRTEPGGISAETCRPISDWHWLEDYLQTNTSLDAILRTFPSEDKPLAAAVKSCAGLRLLLQDPWECLASFILSSTKQIVQIEQIIATLCQRWGDPVPVPSSAEPLRTFPAPDRLACITERELRECKMGFRAPYLLATANAVAQRSVDLGQLRLLPLADARAMLQTLPGVGEKIADCVLLFAGGFREAFPVDVWVNRALSELYFGGRQVPPDRLRRFITKHFGPNAGYAQQYLFHYMRVKARRGPITPVPLGPANP